jgi:putative mRNA 3-end processing factor
LLPLRSITTIHTYLGNNPMTNLLSFTDRGIWCERANIYIDPWKGVDRAIITHAHSDHARRGSANYLAHPTTKHLMHARLGNDLRIDTLWPGQNGVINGVKFSLHPAGHIPGSMQVRVEYKGEVWVASGDHKRHTDGISDAFEPVPCHTFITECTFGLPIYRWKEPGTVFAEMNAWWQKNAADGVCSVVSAYSLGKAQRVMVGVDHTIGPILVHGAVANMNTVLQGCGIQLPDWEPITKDMPKERFRNALVITPGSAIGTPWTNKMKPYASAMASGWMQLRGWRRRGNIDKGFVLSDHADWDALLLAVKGTGAERIITTHGYTDVFSQYLRSIGYDATAESTEFAGQGEGEGDSTQEKITPDQAVPERTEAP